MKKVKISEELIREIHADGKWSQRIQKEVPELFELQVGKWYTTKNYLDTSKAFVFMTSEYKEGPVGFGITGGGDWTGEWHADPSLYKLIPATNKEVNEALEAECVKRYGVDWENAKIKAHADGTHTVDVNYGTWNQTFNVENNRIFNRNGLIFDNGLWAEKFEESNPMDEAIEQYKKDFESFLTKIRK